MNSKIPPIVLFYGLAGLIPFFLAPVGTLYAPDFRWQFNDALLGWSAIILSFLGGARWGGAVQAGQPSPRLIGLSMLPSIAAWCILLVPGNHKPQQLIAFMAAFAAQLAWDWRSGGLPGWYGKLRLVLTAGAVLALAWQTGLQG